MGFFAFVGRVLFSALFIFGAWQELNGISGDTALTVKHMEPKVSLFRGHVKEILKTDLPDVGVEYLHMVAIALVGLGGILFTIGSTLGAYLLMIFLAAATPIMHDFYNFEPDSQQFEQEFVQFLKNFALFGALMFYLGMRSSVAKLAARKRKAPVKTKCS